MVRIFGSMGLTIVVAKNSVAGPSLGPIDAVIILISCRAIPFARTTVRILELNLAQGVAGSCMKLAAI